MRLAQVGVARRDDAREHVGVPREVLRRALPGEVGAEVERALQERRRERAVAAQQRTARVRGLCRPLDVGQRQQRVGRRLDDGERRAVAGPAEVLRVACVVAAHDDAEALEDPGGEPREAVVAARRQGECLALAEHRQADARPGRHAAREDRRLGVLEGAQQRLGLGGYRRVAARIRRRAAGHALEGGRAIEGRGQPARRVVDESAHEQRVGLHGPKDSTPAQLVSREASPSIPASVHQRAADSASRPASSGIGDRRIAPHRGDLEVAAQVVGAALDRVALARSQVGCVRNDALEIAVAPEQLRRGLLPDAAGARDVVGRIAAQRDQGRHLLGLDPVALAHAGAVDALEHAARTRVQHGGDVGDELVHVAVARDDERPASARLLERHRGREQIVGLVGLHLGGREAEGLGQGGYPVELLAEVVGERIALALVGRQQLVAVGGHARVHAHEHGARLRRPPGREQRIGEAHEQAHRPSAGALDVGHGVIGAVPERVPVDHEQRRHRHRS